MGATVRPAERGAETAARIIVSVGRELRDARRDRGLSLETVGRAVGLSRAQASRIERGLVPGVRIATLVRLGAVVGLDLSVRAFPAGPPLRDAAHLALLTDFAARLHRGLRWSTEVPLPRPGDPRAWDGLIVGGGWRIGVEAETAPRDAQALVRRLGLKRRDGAVDAVILLVRDTDRTRGFLREARRLLDADFPVSGSRALELLGAGASPGGSAVVMIRRGTAIPPRPAPRPYPAGGSPGPGPVATG